MGNQQAHKAQQTGKAYGTACQKGGGKYRQKPHPADGYTQGRGGFFSQAQHIQFPGKQQGQHCAGGQIPAGIGQRGKGHTG